MSVINATITPIVALFGALALTANALGGLEKASRLGLDGNSILILGAISVFIGGAFIGILEEWWLRHISKQTSVPVVSVLSVIGFAAGTLLGGLGFQFLSVWEVSLLFPFCMGGALSWLIGIALPIAILRGRFGRSLVPSTL